MSAPAVRTTDAGNASPAARLDLAQLITPAALPDFWRRWPTASFCAGGDLARLAAITSAPQLQDLRSILGLTSRLPPIRVRAWFNVGSDGLKQTRPSSAAEALTLYDAGRATIVVDGIDQMLPQVADLLWTLEQDLGIPRSRFGCNLYASRTGIGSVMHFDEQENFFLQLRGRKRWRICRNEQVPFPRAPYFGGVLPEPLRCLTDGLPRTMPADAETHDLTPGAVLFVPRGFWHESSTLEDSLALTLTLQTTTWTDALLDLFTRRLNLSERWREPIWDRGSDPDRVDGFQQTLSERLAELAGALGSDRWAADLADSIGGRDRVRFRSGVTWRAVGEALAVRVEDGGIAGGEVTVPRELGALLERFAGQRQPFVWQEAAAAAGVPATLASERIRGQLTMAGIMDPAWHLPR